VGASVVVVVAGAALITVLLPFHEMNAEISARTTPTALDLLTAAFCALAGVYATLRPGSAIVNEAGCREREVVSSVIRVHLQSPA
jgi:uncharacterized membrane protein